MTLNNKKVLVTGGAGFIGSHLVDRLLKEGCKVAVIDNLSSGKKENLAKKARFYKLDVENPGISRVFKKEKLEIVFHLAAQIDLRKSVNDPVSDAKTNILGSLNVLENCRKFGVKKIVFASTGGAIYGEVKTIPTGENYPVQPLSPYGIAKLATEKYLEYYLAIFNLPFVALRLANVYGPRQDSQGEAGVIAIFCGRMLSAKPAQISGSGFQTRDFVFVQDVVAAFIKAMETTKTGIYNIGTGQETDINSIFRKLKKLTGSKIKEKHGAQKPGEQKRSCLDWSKARKELGWRPREALDEGLKKTIKWFKDI